jgi:hypothetical protein
MNTTGIFTIHRYEIRDIKIGEPIYLIPFGDIHRSAPQCHTEKWSEFLAWAKKKPRSYFLGMGDYDDLASTSERVLLGNNGLHDSTVKTLEGLYLKHIERLAKEIGFMHGRLVGLLEGNHYGVFQNNTTTTQKLCEFMGCPYLGVNSFIRLSLGYKKHPHNYSTIDIWAHHGRGAARTAGGRINTVEQMAKIAEADIYLCGHDHSKGAVPVSRLRLGASGHDLKLSQRKVFLIKTGSFLKAYEPNEPSYVVDAAMPPTDLGVVKIELTLRREQKNGDITWIDIHASV